MRSVSGGVVLTQEAHELKCELWWKPLWPPLPSRMICSFSGLSRNKMPPQLQRGKMTPSEPDWTRPTTAREHVTQTFSLINSRVQLFPHSQRYWVILTDERRLCRSDQPSFTVLTKYTNSFSSHSDKSLTICSAWITAASQASKISWHQLIRWWDKIKLSW